MSNRGRLSLQVKRYLTWLLELPRYYKRALLVVLDLLSLNLVLWVALSFRLGAWYLPPNPRAAILLAAGPLLTVAFLWHFGIYRMVTRFVDRQGKAQVLFGVALSVLVWSLIVFMAGQSGVPRTVILVYGLTGAIAVLGLRGLIKLVLETVGAISPLLAAPGPRKATLIYGADQIGIELLQAVRRARDRNVVGFVDSSPTLWRQYVSGLKVYSPQRLARLIEREHVEEVLIALPGDRRQERKQVVRELERLPVAIKILPTYEDITSGNVSVKNLRNVEVGDLLGRDAVAPNLELLRRNTTGKSILVTGAGGSIGSEIVKHVVQQSPRRIVLLDISERALYQIELEIRRLLDGRAGLPAPEIKVVLGSVTDPVLMDQVMREHEINTIFHAAAYKHVPIVEGNPFVGIENNVFGTLVTAQAARNHGVERFVLISTDKAVRPTNIMGASKRIAELILQAQALEPGSTIFTMVRFGNVLDSSGSVVPLFRQQIDAGGPITVTHPEITRYFMSIPEAAELVIQAGAMARGGEVFVLHMGDPVRIDDLARLMVRLSNLEVRDASNPNGDIEIVYTGLRPGEKLYEELLIGAHTQTTEHIRIFKSDEPIIPMIQLKHELDQLKAATLARDRAAVQAILARTVEGYRPGSEERGSIAAEGWSPGLSQTLH